jgi:hypothetical protein
LLELLLIEQLPTDNAIDLRAQITDAILICKLHLGLMRDEAREHVVVERKVRRGSDRPHTHDDEGPDRDPKRYGAKPYLSSSMGQQILVTVVARPARRMGLPIRPRSARVGRTGCGVAVMMNTSSVH